MRLLLLSAVVLTTACGVPVDAPVLMNCDLAAQRKCEEWRGDRMDATNSKVNFDALCSSELNGQIIAVCAGNDVGTCVERPSVAKRVIITHYYGPDFTAASVREDCTSKQGTFSP